MRKIISAIGLLATSPALAGSHSQVEQVTHCFKNKGETTTINRLGNTYLTQEADNRAA
jgi:hypothetical protein